jgi:hypothetical protein
VSFELFLPKNRTSYHSITLYEADDNGLTLAAEDEVRLKVYRRDQATPILDIDSIGALSNGSIITIDQTASAAMATLKVVQGDIADAVLGAYDAELSVVDSADSNRIKVAEQGTVHILGTGGGDIGAT